MIVFFMAFVVVITENWYFEEKELKENKSFFETSTCISCKPNTLICKVVDIHEKLEFWIL